MRTAPLALSAYGDVASRKAALATIFGRLGSTTFRGRRDVMRRIIRELSIYIYYKEETELRSTSAEYNRWFKAVNHHASALVELFEQKEAGDKQFLIEKITGEKAEQVYDRLRTVAHIGNFRNRGQRGRPSDMPLHYLIVQVATLYRASTGKKPVLSCHNSDPYGRNEKHGDPCGPFFDLIEAVLALLGEERGQETIANAIGNIGKNRNRRAQF